MKFDDLKTAYAGRGFNHLSDTERGQDINTARAMLDGMYLWPYREKSVTGIAPLAVTDLGVVEAVSNEDTDFLLAPGDFSNLHAEYGDLALTGNAAYFYVASPEGVPVVATYPESTATIGVQYWKITPDLEDDNDEPEAPSRFHSLIVDLAAQRGYIRTDNFQAAQALGQFIDREIGMMVDQLLGGQQIAGPSSHVIVWDACDA